MILLLLVDNEKEDKVKDENGVCWKKVDSSFIRGSDIFLGVTLKGPVEIKDMKIYGNLVKLHDSHYLRILIYHRYLMEYLTYVETHKR